MKAKDLTVNEVAKELSLHADTVKRLLRLGALPGYKADLKQWRVTRAALDGYKAGGGAKRPGRPKKAEANTEEPQDEATGATEGEGN